MRILFVISLLTFFAPFNNPPIVPEPKLKLIASGLMAPVCMECPKDGSGRMFVCEQTGKIKLIKNGIVQPKTFLDIGVKLDDVNKIYSEKGLLGMAFHPKFKSNGKFYIYYTAKPAEKKYDNKCIVAEYKVSSDPDIADASSHKVILEIDQPESNHNGGQLAFGPDGYLYIGSGDGGGAGDRHGSTGNGQNLTTLLGKILRIDVDSKSPYAIPPDNPFVNTKSIRQEIWAYGMRNPWRFSFDRKTGQLFCADVGQDKWEEIDIIKKGKNYGWRIMEGNHCFEPATGCKTDKLEFPIAEYDHDLGISVTGGYVYRGKNIPAMQGKYIFGDWKGDLLYLGEKSGKWSLNHFSADGKPNDIRMNINSFAEDESGEIYLLTQKTTGALLVNGAVYRIEM